MTTAFQSHYIPNTAAEQDDLLAAIGLHRIDDLFADIPEGYRNPPLPPARPNVRNWTSSGNWAQWHPATAPSAAAPPSSAPAPTITSSPPPSRP